MLDGKVKYFKMKYNLHVLVVLAINVKIAVANFHFTECNINEL